MSNKSRKHRAVIKKLTLEKHEYEARANLMVNQMSEQLTLLQKMAVERIDVSTFLSQEIIFFAKISQLLQVLEKELMVERSNVEKVQNENSVLRAAAVSESRRRSKHPASNTRLYESILHSPTIRQLQNKNQIKSSKSRRSKSSVLDTSINSTSSADSNASSCTIMNDGDNDCTNDELQLEAEEEEESELKENFTENNFENKKCGEVLQSINISSSWSI
jgi:hypothetical protein